MSSIRPLKALGQHFLTNLDTASRIAHSLSEEARNRLVLEIGPGTGVLTHELIEAGVRNLHCVEVDERSVEFLLQRFPLLKDKIHLADFLSADLGFLGDGTFSVIGNFPYNISSQILFRVLEMYERVPELAGMFQKEVAQRIASPPGNRDYGILSVLLQAHYDIEYLFTVPPEYFNPPPKVDSGVIRMQLRKDHKLDCDEVFFKRVVKTAFNQRRKTMRNSLKSLLPADYSSIPYLDMRPEQLHFSAFVTLTNALKSR
ncbi:MAG: 16S rRNA (adenine(1518)-N(6)/adenine(1519)-N(6))-dimethyltransferase RsmA [Arcticibacter sp.]